MLPYVKQISIKPQHQFKLSLTFLNYCDSWRTGLLPPKLCRHWSKQLKWRVFIEFLIRHNLITQTPSSYRRQQIVSVFVENFSETLASVARCFAFIAATAKTKRGCCWLMSTSTPTNRYLSCSSSPSSSPSPPPSLPPPPPPPSPPHSLPSLHPCLRVSSVAL